jgi:hypothetical protein
VAPSGRVDCEDWWRCPCPAGVADGLTAIGLGDLATRLRPTLVTLCCRLILFVTTDRACSPVWTAISGQEPGLLFVKSDRTRRAEVIRAKEMQGVGRGQRPAAAGRLGAVRTDEHQPRRKSGAVTGHEHVRSVVVSKISRLWSTRARDPPFWVGERSIGVACRAAQNTSSCGPPIRADRGCRFGLHGKSSLT